MFERIFTRKEKANGAEANGTAVSVADNPLFKPWKLGRYDLKHRIIYAPLTRCRAFGKIPQALAAQYYSERATAGGLMISEGTVVSERGHGYPCTPGINTQEQVEAWKPIVQAVHDKGATFFCQLWHVGRASHQHYQPNEEAPISSSNLPIRDGNQCFSLKSMQMEDYPEPRALELKEIPTVIDEFRTGAKNAIAAGFDGVEIHGANGYLLDQFLKDNINKRTDNYGGSIENRCRLVLEVVKACCEEIGSDRVGIRFSPFGGFLDATDSHPYALYTYLLEELNAMNLAYVHFVEPRTGGNDDLPEDPNKTLAPFRSVYKGTFLAAGGYQRENAMEAIAKGTADGVVFGRWFLANPDFVARLALDAPLNKYDRETFYSQAPEGYIDYPFLKDTEWGKKNVELVESFKLPA